MVQISGQIHSRITRLTRRVKLLQNSQSLLKKVTMGAHYNSLEKPKLLLANSTDNKVGTFDVIL